MANKKTYFIVAALGGLLATGASQLAGLGDESAAEGPAPESAELKRLREQVRKLEASVASSERLAREAQVTARAAQARAEAAPVPERLPEPPKQEEAPVAKAPAAAPAEPSPDEVIDQMDERFFLEEVDPAWSRDARHRVERLGGLMPEGARIVAVECRSSMCRMEMSHPSLESFQGFVRKGLMGPESEWDGGLMAAVKGDPYRPGGIQAVAYLGRPEAQSSRGPVTGR